MTRVARSLRAWLAAAAALTLWTAGAALAAPGDLDTSFGDAGTATLRVAPGGRTDAALAPDGKIVVVGQRDNIARLNADGSLDRTFATDGTLKHDADTLEAWAVQPSGKIVLAYIENVPDPVLESVQVLTIRRLLADGSPDPSFGSGGRVTVKSDETGYGVPVAVATANDGDVLIGLRDGMGVFRLTDTGGREQGFDSDGFAEAHPGAELRFMEVDGSGRILLVGTDGDHTIVERMSSTGTRETGYGQSGTADLGSSIDVHDVALAPDGKLMLVGSGREDNFPVVAAARLTDAGTPDTGFGGDGFVALPKRVPATAEAVLVRADGGLLIGGIARAGREEEQSGAFTLVRLSPSGVHDGGFGPGGVVRTPFDDPNVVDATITRLLRRPDGTVLAFGREVVPGEDEHQALAQYLPDGGSYAPPPAAPTVPESTFVTTPAAEDASLPAQFAVSANRSGVTFECSLDSEPFAFCDSGPQALLSFFDLAPGPHTLAVRAVDEFEGQVEPEPATFSWKVLDRDPPVTLITEGPADETEETGASFSFEDDSGEPAGFECSLDGAAFAACTSPVSFTGLGRGSHTFRVRAFDAAGNRDPSPAAVTWRIGALGPPPTFPGIDFPTDGGGDNGGGAPGGGAPGGDQGAGGVGAGATPGGAAPGGGGPSGTPIGASGGGGSFTKDDVTAKVSKETVIVTADVPGPGTVAAALDGARASAAARRRAARLRLGSARRSVTTAGRVVLRVKLRASALRKLRRARRVRARLVVTFTPKGGKATSVSRTLTISLKRRR